MLDLCGVVLERAVGWSWKWGGPGTGSGVVLERACGGLGSGVVLERMLIDERKKIRENHV